MTAPNVIWYDPTPRRIHPAQPEPEKLADVEYVRADLVRAAMPINATDEGDPELQRLAEVLGMTANTALTGRAPEEQI